VAAGVGRWIPWAAAAAHGVISSTSSGDAHGAEGRPVVPTRKRKIKTRLVSDSGSDRDIVSYDESVADYEPAPIAIYTGPDSTLYPNPQETRGGKLS
jgi:hypothetical protein